MGDIEQFFQDSHYNIVRVLLSISGLWPFDTQIKRYVIYFALTLILGSGFIFEILGVIEVRHDTFEIIDSVPMLFFTMLILSKMLCTVYTLPKIKILLIKMQEYCLSPKSDEETKIQNLHAQYGQKLGYAYTGFLLSHSFLYLLTTLLTRLFYVKSVETNETSDQKMIGLPHRVNYMVDLNTYYVPIFIHSAICDFTLTFLLVTCDIIYFIAVEHCCGLFAALRYRLEIALVFEKDKLSTTKDKSYSNIVYSICRHKETMQFVAVIESVCSLSLVIQLSSSILVISFLGHQVINNIENVEIVKPICFLNAGIFNIFLENWQGQKIIDSSERVFESAYNTEWYNMPIAARKLLIMIMIRSERPLMLKLGKIVALSYVTFNTILRTSSSYFMLLQSL